MLVRSRRTISLLASVVLVLSLMGVLLPSISVVYAVQPTFTNGQNATLVLGQADFNNYVDGTTQTRMSQPNDIAVDLTTGKIFVVDRTNNRVLRFGSLASLMNGASAEGVLGQATFTSKAPATTQNGMNFPLSLAFDSTGRLWVVDSGNSRVLRFNAAASKANGAPADGVLGQTNFTSNTKATTQSGMRDPYGLALDNGGRLWVADQYNHRVLRFDNVVSKADGAAADGVLGQADFISGGSAIGQSRMNLPLSVTVDSAGRLWVADKQNNRVLRFDNAASKAPGANADGVLGQANFTSGANATSQSGMYNPYDVQVDTAGRLWVADTYNHRALWFDSAASKADGALADGVLGQTNFTSGANAIGQNRMYYPQGVGMDGNNQPWVADTYNGRALYFGPLVSTNADLSGLTLSSGTLSPAFADTTTSYTANVTSGVSSITVTPTVADADATVTVNGMAVVSGTASGAIPLSVGTNTITIVVTAADGVTTKTTTITVTRAAPVPTTVSVGATPSSITAGVSATSTITATVRDQSNTLMAGVLVTFSVPSGGGAVSPTTATTDANGVATTTYTGGTAAGSATVRATASGGAYGETTISLVNNPPVLSISDIVDYNAGTSAVVVAPNLTITDDNDENIDGAQASIRTNFDSSTNRLGISGQGSATSGTVGSLSWSYNTTSGMLTFSGTASTSTYQAALRQVTFSTSGSPTLAARTVQFVLGSSLANPANGHFYKFVSSSGIAWDTARDDAALASSKLFGLQGYLATITSDSESSFILSRLVGSGWIGASDATSEGDWRWVTGPEAGTQFWSGDQYGSPFNGQYSNWAPDEEPNNAGNEDYAHIVGNPALGYLVGYWNDLPISVTSGNYAPLGYLVEYGGMPGDPTLQFSDEATVNVVDTSAPAAPIISAPADGDTTGNRPTFSGTAEDGATVAVVENGVTICTAVATGGTWGCAATNDLSNGAHTAIATATDASSNVSQPSASVSYTIDATQPDAPIITAPAEGAATLARPTFSGTAEPGTTVTVTEGNANLCTVVATGGTWSCTPSFDLVEGMHSVVATATDGVGNDSQASLALGFVVDLTAPVAPEISAPALGEVVGIRPTFSGTAEDGATVTVVENGVTICTAVATGGTWSCRATSDLANGTHTISAIATDSIGNISLPSADLSITVDAIAPAAPEINTPTDGALVGGRPTFSGTGEDGAIITVVDNGVTICTALVIEGGWNCAATIDLSNGPHTLNAIATDSAGNASPPSPSRSFVVDATAPAAPVITSPATTTDKTPTIAGTATAGLTVRVQLDLNDDDVFDVTYTTTASAGGTWSIDTATATPTSGSFPAAGLADGSYTVLAVTISATSVESQQTGQTLTVDTTTPAAPTITSSANASVATPLFTGTAEPNTMVTLGIDLNGDGSVDVTYRADVNSAGFWSVNTASANTASGSFPAAGLANGSYAITATTSDAVGNVSAPASQTLTVAAAPFVSPTIAIVLKGFRIKPTLFGTAMANHRLRVRLSQNGPPASVLRSQASDTVEYLVSATTSGTWTIDTAAAVPNSGQVPEAGYKAGLLLYAQVTDLDAPTGTAASVSAATSVKAAYQVLILLVYK